MQIRRHFTKSLNSPYDGQTFVTRQVAIRDADGVVIFSQDNVVVPESWSQLATDILAQKYFRPTVPESDVRQLFHRLAGCWADWGRRGGYFTSDEDAKAFYDEIVYMLSRQMAAPNSPQWFNTGVHFAYGLDAPSDGHYFVDAKTGEVVKSTSGFARPQPHACFILSISDDLVNPGGIMDLWVREARLFKYGAGTGTNFSRLRAAGEKLSGGGTSSGLMSFLKIGDRAAGAIKSGGTTRRAAKMVCLDLDHPEVEEFIGWKALEEEKVRAMVKGSSQFTADWQGEAYRTVSGQNSNNSVRIPDSFFAVLDADGSWPLRWRRDGTVAREINARELWRKIAEAAHASADPGLQFHSTINRSHTCPSSGEIRASNPCSEYMFLDDTACNLASLNLASFIDDTSGEIDRDGLTHACRLWTLVLEISVSMAQFPSPEVARNSHDYRTLGLGYANLGAVLMSLGLPYDSSQARSLCSTVTALMTGVCYQTSAEMAKELGAFNGFAKNKGAMLKVLQTHQAAAMALPPSPCSEAIQTAWKQALLLGEAHGFRNAQVTAIAPTGTIGIVMDCDTTGIEPEFSLLSTKTLAGGGRIQKVSRSISKALKKLGYSPDIIGRIAEAPEKIGSLIRPEHQPVFHCAHELSYEAHIEMLAAAQPFVSGAISKTVNLPARTSVEEIEKIFRYAWERGLKSISIYRDGSKLSQPLNTDPALAGVERLAASCYCP